MCGCVRVDGARLNFFGIDELWIRGQRSLTAPIGQTVWASLAHKSSFFTTFKFTRKLFPILSLIVPILKGIFR